MSLNLNLLKTFVVLAEIRNFTNTASKLHTVQPAISRQIRSLESSLGFELFIRNRKGVFITDQGQEFYKEVKTALSLLDKAVQSSARESSEVVNIRVQSPPDIGQNILWPHLIKIQNAYPNYRFNLNLTSSEAALKAIGEGTTDIGFVSRSISSKNIICSEKIQGSIFLIQSKDIKENLLKSAFREIVSFGEADYLTDSFLRKKLSKRTNAGFTYSGFINSHVGMIEAVMKRKCVAVIPSSSLRNSPYRSQIKILAEDKGSFGMRLICSPQFKQRHEVLWKMLCDIQVT